MDQEDDLKIVKVAAKTLDLVNRMISLQEDFVGYVKRVDEQVETNAQESRQRDEENQHNIKFILEQQAQFTVDIQQLREAQAQADEKWERRWGRTEDGIRSLLSIAEIHDREITILAETQKSTVEATAEAQARTDRQMAETDERLNALINVAEQLISERRRNGDAQGDAGQ